MQITVEQQENIGRRSARLYGIKDACQMLFDLWCERRGVIAIAYLNVFLADAADIRSCIGPDFRVIVDLAPCSHVI